MGMLFLGDGLMVVSSHLVLSIDSLILVVLKFLGITVDNLEKKNIRVGLIVFFCDRHVETVLHLFVNCPAIKLI